MGSQGRISVLVAAGFLAVGLVIGALLVYFTLAPQTPKVFQVKFVLDWAIQGPQAPFIVALEKGYFAQEGLAVTVDRGYGSADAITKVASGAYHIGYGSIDALIEFNAKNPGNELVAVYVVLNRPPYAVVTLKEKGINSPKELEGKRIGAPEGDAARRLFPVFAKAVGIDPRKVEWVSVAPQLRETTLVKGEVDAVTGFEYTVVLNLRSLNVESERIVVFRYSDLGLPLYGNAIIVRKDFAQSHPDVVARFVRAVNRALKDVISNPAEAAELIKVRDPLVDKDLEYMRLTMALKNNVLTEEVGRLGLGAVDKSRLEQTIRVVAEAFGLPRVPSVDEVFTERFLPPLEERKT
jgi:NitT/TauT family transport system substrate-binding protein